MTAQEDDDYDLRQRFKNEGVEPLWPSHPSWKDFNDIMSIFIMGGLDCDATTIHDLLEMYRNERCEHNSDNTTHGYGLAATPIIDTYIRWCTKYKEFLNGGVCFSTNTVSSHPIIIEALCNYILALDQHQLNDVLPTVHALTETAPLGANIQQHITNNINHFLQSTLPFSMSAVAALTPYLNTPLKIPMNQTDKFVLLMNDEWPYEEYENRTITQKSHWFRHVARLEPVIAALLESEVPDDILIGGLYNHLSMIDFNKKDIYTTWLYVALQEFIQRESVIKSPQYDDVQTLVLDTIKVIPKEQQDLWRKQLSYLNGLYDNALAKALILEEYSPNAAQYPLDSMDRP